MESFVRFAALGEASYGFSRRRSCLLLAPIVGRSKCLFVFSGFGADSLTFLRRLPRYGVNQAARIVYCGCYIDCNVLIHALLCHIVALTVDTDSQFCVFAKRRKSARILITLECTEARKLGLPPSRYYTSKNKVNTPERLELMKYNKYLRRHTLHKEIK